MTDEIVPQNPENSESEKEQIASLAQFLEALQQRYRTEMGDAEYLDWLQTLKAYSLPEVIAAGNELTLNPPEGWTGLPKLPDMLRAIHREREAAAERQRQWNGRKVLAEMRDLQKRKDAGEQFYSLADVLKAMPEKFKAMERDPESLEKQKRELLK